MKRLWKVDPRYALSAMAALLGLVLFSPVTASAQTTTILHVRVTLTQPARVSVYCDTGTACGNPIWDAAHNFPLTGVVLSAGQTLVLTQTGLTPVVGGGLGGGNFDTSDSVQPNGTTNECEAGDLCSVKIEIDTGSGFVVTNLAQNNPINNFNAGTLDDKAEYNAYAAVAVTDPSYTLAVGYADDVHSLTCITAGCDPVFPSPFNGTYGSTAASVFVGGGAAGNATDYCNNVSPGHNCFDGGAILITATPQSNPASGRMTGGGSVFTADGIRVTHGFELHCDIAALPNNLEINWAGGNNFHLDALTKVTCIDDPAIAPPPPAAGFDTYIGEGTGTLNGLPATIKFTLTDAGEPGTKDTAKYEITQNSSVVLTVGPAFLVKGNQQAHKD